jgi:hypothetical protein
VDTAPLALSALGSAAAPSVAVGSAGSIGTSSARADTEANNTIPAAGHSQAKIERFMNALAGVGVVDRMT